MRPQQLLLPAVLLAQIPHTLAWGALGHQTIAYVASNFVSVETKTFCQKILSDTSAAYLANVATWADSYRETTSGNHRVHPELTIITLKKTTRVQSKSLASEQIFEALKFIIHFVGDSHQPLHDEALDLGGNDITVTFAGKSTNLHAIWDTNMPEKYIGGTSSTTLADALTWSKTLTTAIKSGTYKSQSASWLTGLDLGDPVATAMVWATQANAEVCTTVLKGGVGAVEMTDLSGAYYTAALPVIQLQFARAGYRLAGWLNLIATGEVGL
ncbi:hypothetical protein MMC09_006398 [Bachmanniomyces sp. S44760]|nr:hypothetical protein [Bachmanniomyces sp. S44760]